jgi:hypothetical protein
MFRKSHIYKYAIILYIYINTAVSVVDIATGLWVGRPGLRIPAVASRFSGVLNFPDWLCGPPSFAEDKAAGS